jgi:hypothetical protein
VDWDGVGWVGVLGWVVYDEGCFIAVVAGSNADEDVVVLVVVLVSVVIVVISVVVVILGD